MTTRARCPRCGKSSAYAEADAGLTALCMACGAKYTIPRPAATKQKARANATHERGSAAPAASAVSAVSAAGSPSATAAGLDPPTSPAPDPDATVDLDPVAARAATPGRAVFWAVLAGGLVAVAALVIVLVFATHPGWEQRNRDALRDLKSRADALALAGQTHQAIDLYDQLLRLTNDRPLRDATLKSQIELARASRERLFRQFLDQAAPPSPPESSRPAVATAGPQPPTDHRPTDHPPGKNPPADAPPAAATPPPEAASAPAADPLAALALLLEYYSDPQKFLDARTMPQRPIESHLPSAQPPIAPAPPPASDVASPTDGRAGHPAADGPPPLRIRRLPPPRELVTDEEIGRSIQRGVDWMINRFDNGQLISTRGPRDNAYTSGLNALCVYALLQSAYAIKDERLNLKGPYVRRLVEVMKETPMDLGPVTYARGIRATALSLIDRREDRAALTQDVRYLLESHIDGAYTYFKPTGYRAGRGGGGRGASWDNSNSQYGLLGVWSAAEVGAEVNSGYWSAVEQHWMRCQLDDGAWAYTGYNERAGSARLSMTVAGIASLFVTHDYLDAPRFGAAVGRAPFSPALARGLAWLETEDRAISPNGGYTLYGIERVGLASGFKFLGDHDWYRELARQTIDQQADDGSWGGEMETAYKLLFLARGRHPILMNKLRFDGAWANRPRDVANLARFAARELERPLNWQVVPLERDWTEWTDSPILYIASHTPPRLTPQDLDKIRSFVAAGGLLFTQADGAKPEMDQWAAELAGKIFHPYEMQDLPADHELYSLHYRLEPAERPRLRFVSNGSRILMLHSPSDVSQHWQLRAEKSKRAMFALGVNFFLYASGKADLRNRLTSSYIPPLSHPPSGGAVNVLRLRYPGNWNPEPMAWTRFARYLQLETDVGLNIAPLDLADVTILRNPAPTVAHLTGTHACSFTQPQLAAIRQFVEEGGVLVVDPCGGSADFLDSARAAIRQAFGGQTLRLIDAGHPLLSASRPGMLDLGTPQLRPFVQIRSPGIAGRLEILAAGKGRVILSPLDLTTGLLGANTWGIHGFEPAYASGLMRNIVIWTANGMKD